MKQKKKKIEEEKGINTKRKEARGKGEEEIREGQRGVGNNMSNQREFWPDIYLDILLEISNVWH